MVRLDQQTFSTCHVHGHPKLSIGFEVMDPNRIHLSQAIDYVLAVGDNMHFEPAGFYSGLGLCQEHERLQHSHHLAHIVGAVTHRTVERFTLKGVTANEH